jgi:hypothetical protein
MDKGAFGTRGNKLNASKVRNQISIADQHGAYN